MEKVKCEQTDFANLSKEELIIKCQTLNSDLQNLKSSENIVLKESEKNDFKNSAINEIVEKLTEEKLQLVNQIEDLKIQNNKIEQSLKINKEEQISAKQKIDELETENISYQRRVTRLSDDNEQLLGELALLENEMKKISKIGTEQRQQLLEVTKSNETIQDKLMHNLEEMKELKNVTAKKELIIKELTNEIQALKIVNLDNKKVSNKLEDLNKLNENYAKELNEYKSINDKLKEKVKSYHSKLKLFSQSAKEIKQEKNEVLKIFKNYTDEINDWKCQLHKASKKLLKIITKLQDDNKILKESNAQVTELRYQEKQQYEIKRNELNGICERHKSHIDKLTEQLETNNNYWQQEIMKSNEKLQHNMFADKQLAEKSIEEILKLTQTNKELEAKISQLVENLDKGSKTFKPETDFPESEINFKRENSELLHEMIEMNQALKIRGETISKLEAHCDEIKKKLLVYETQANRNIDSITEKENLIHKLNLQIESLTNTNEDSNEISTLKGEIEILKEKLGNNVETSYNDSEIMSNISKSDEMNRMKDFDSSWEEKYGKLRNLAVKLKGKLKEQTVTINDLEGEKVGLEKELKNNQDNIHEYQKEIDNYKNQLIHEQMTNKQYLEKLNAVAVTISKDKQKLAENDELIGNLNKQIEQYNENKCAVETWKKQVAAKVQTLRKELESKQSRIKESESEISKLHKIIENKEKELKEEQDNHKQTKSELEQTLNECKRNSVLNLEMKDYEKSLKELSQKCDKQNSDINNLQMQLESQEAVVNDLRHQNKLYQDRLEHEEASNEGNLLEINTCKTMITNLEELVQRKELKILDVTKQLEAIKTEKEELVTELTREIAIHQKSLTLLKNERDQLRSQIISLQQNLRDSMDTLKLKSEEVDSIRDDYEAYKIRAQNLLKKNNNRDVSCEEKLTEELERVKSQNSRLDVELADLKINLQHLQDTNTTLISEKLEYLRKCQDLEDNKEQLKCQNEKLLEKYKKEMLEYTETIRNLKIHNETISQCYRQQLNEQETRHNKEIIELQSQVDKTPSPSLGSPLNLPGLNLSNMPREEGEGSENVEDNAAVSKPQQQRQLIQNHLHPVPLERLLESESTAEITNYHLKKQITEQETKLIHLTALLSDTEQDLSKHIQMNKVLKEEIRRQQRSAEREKHAENLEYLKNVVVKFVTLNSGDERSRLVPVLNTILKLSPEETQKLTTVAKGDPGLIGWVNSLPLWTSPTKPSE